MTNCFLTKKPGEPWVSFSVTSGNDRHIVRMRATVSSTTGSAAADEVTVRAVDREGEWLSARDGATGGGVRAEGLAGNGDRVGGRPLGGELAVDLAGALVGVGERAVGIGTAGV